MTPVSWQKSCVHHGWLLVSGESATQDWQEGVGLPDDDEGLEAAVGALVDDAAQSVKALPALSVHVSSSRRA